MVIAATTMPVLSCDSSDSSPLTSVPPQAAIRSLTDGALSSGSSGSANAGTPCPSSAFTTASEVTVGPVRDDREQRAVVGVELADRQVRGRPDALGRPVVRVQHQQHRAAEVGGDLRVERELRGRADVGVVAADHDHRVRLVGDLVEPVDDPVQRRLRVAVQVGVRDAGALLVGQLDGVVGDQQVQDVVGGRVAADDGAVDRHAFDPARQLFEHAQRDRRLAREALHRRDVHARGHVSDPSRARRGVRDCGRQVEQACD